MINIMIGDYKIISEANQFILYHVTKLGVKSKKPGADVDNFVGYYSSIKSCLLALPQGQHARHTVLEAHERQEVQGSHDDPQSQHRREDAVARASLRAGCASPR